MGKRPFASSGADTTAPPDLNQRKRNWGHGDRKDTQRPGLLLQKWRVVRPLCALATPSRLKVNSGLAGLDPSFCGHFHAFRVSRLQSGTRRGGVSLSQCRSRQKKE